MTVERDAQQGIHASTVIVPPQGWRNDTAVTPQSYITIKNLGDFYDNAKLIEVKKKTNRLAFNSADLETCTIQHFQSPSLSDC